MNLDIHSRDLIGRDIIRFLQNFPFDELKSHESRINKMSISDLIDDVYNHATGEKV